MVKPIKALRPGRNRLARIARGLVAGVCVALCGLAIAATPQGLSFERRIGLDWLFWMRGARTPPPNIAIVGINSGTGPALNLPRLPHHWPRAIHATLIESLVRRQAAVIVFDIDFHRSKGGEDALLAQAIAESNRVVLYQRLEARVERVAAASAESSGSVWVEEDVGPAQPLAAAARALGPFPVPRQDKAVSEFWTFKDSIGYAATAPAVALQLLALSAYDEWASTLKTNDAPGLEKLPPRARDVDGPDAMRRLMQQSRRILQQNDVLVARLRRAFSGPDSKARQMLSALTEMYAGPDHQLLNFYGPTGRIRTIPYERVATAAAPAAGDAVGDLSGHVVFVGYSDLDDPTSLDRIPTSLTREDGVELSGVEIMATAYANLLDKRPLRSGGLVFDGVIVAAFGLAAGLLIYGLPATLAAPLAGVGAILYASVIQLSFNRTDLWLPLATPILIQLPLALFAGLIGQYVIERRTRERASAALLRYVPEDIARELTERPLEPARTNREMFGICLASDMSGFSGLAEQRSPSELAQLLNDYFDALAKALKARGADVTDFRADMIMCAWISEQRESETARRGLEAAIEVSEIICRFAATNGMNQIVPRVGLEAGPLYIGHTGGGGRFVYTVQGDAANTAARLESLNKQLGTRILAGETVAHHADTLLVRPLGLFKFSGKAMPTNVFEIVGSKGAVRSDQLLLCADFAEALAAFQRKEWRRASRLFEAIAARFPVDRPSQFYMRRSQEYAAAPPEPERAAIIEVHDK
ncbi:MAG: CHASE2 domain-containing protein [Hyphomicrobium sp.]